MKFDLGFENTRFFSILLASSFCEIIKITLILFSFSSLLLLLLQVLEHKLEQEEEARKSEGECATDLMRKK